MPDEMKTAELLGTFAIFKGMGKKELEAIARVTGYERFEPGEVVITEGDVNDSLYLIVEGDVGIYGGYGAPDQDHKATIGPGTFLGELSLFTQMPPNATCVAATKAALLVVPHGYFIETMKTHPLIGINLCRYFSMKLRQVRY